MNSDRNRINSRASVALAAALLQAALIAVVTVSAQDAERRPVIGGLSFIDEVEVTVVNVDVFVRDRRGKAVTGLTREDFRLLQDGQERPLSHFAGYTSETIAGIMAAREAEASSAVVEIGGAEEGTTLSAGTAADMVQPVHIVLYVDNENIRPFDRNRVLAQVRGFVREVMQPHVQVMVVSVQRSAKIIQPFTNDPRQVQDALRSLTRVYGARVDQDRQRGRIIHDLQAIMDSPPTGGLRADSVAMRDLEDKIRIYAEEMAVELDYSMTALREVLTTMAGLPGRKVLLHVSSGLPAVLARDLISWYGQLFQNTSTLPMLARFNRRQVYEGLAASANSQGVTFYTIDASGLGGDAAASAEYARPVDPMISSIHVINYQEQLLYLAESTGGRAIVDSNDVTGLLEEMRNDIFTYYSLGYTLSASGSDTIHRIEVVLPRHPEYELVYRRALVEKSLETQVQDRVVSGLMLALDDNPMAVELQAGSETAALDDRWILPVEISIPIDSVALIPGPEDFVGRVVVYLANRDLKGRQSDVQRRDIEIRMSPADYETRRHERYVVTLDLLLEAGDHKLVVGLLDPVTRQASFAILRRTVPAG